MKRIITLLAVALTANLSISQVVTQSDFSTWTGTTTPGWGNTGRTSFSATGTATYAKLLPTSNPGLRGGNAVQLINNHSSHRRFATDSLAVTPGSYEIKIWYLADSIVNIRSNFYKYANGTVSSGYGTYTSYKALPTSTGLNPLIFADTVVIGAGVTGADFILSIDDQTNSSGLGIDSVVITKLSVVVPPTPTTYLTKTIYDIQYTTAANGDSPYADSLVETSGIVTAVDGTQFFLQDGTTAWNGVYVYNFLSAPSVSIGDNITIKGKVEEYNGLTEIKDLDTIIVNSTGNTLPAPIAVTTSSMQDEQYEGCLVKLTAATCVNPSAGFGEWQILNTIDTGRVDDLMYVYTPVMGTNYNITGILHYSFGFYKVEPRDSLDIVVSPPLSIYENGSNLEYNAYPNPVQNMFTLTGANLEIAEIYSATGQLVRTIRLNTINTIDVSDLKKGVYILKVHSGDRVGTSRFVKQ